MEVDISANHTFFRLMNGSDFPPSNQTRRVVLAPWEYIRHLQIAISICGLIVNSVTIVIIGKFCGTLTSHYLLVCNQSVCDAMICLFTGIERSLTFSHGFPQNDVFVCVMMVTIIVRMMSFVVSLLNLIVITVSRFIAVWRPNDHQTLFSRGKTLWVICSLYSISLLVTIVILTHVVVMYRARDDASVCISFFANSGTDIIDFTLVVLFFALFGIIHVVYIYVAVVLKKRKMPTEVGRRQCRKRTHNIIVTSFWVVITFVVCFAPYAFVRIITRFGGHHFVGHRNDVLFNASVYLGVLPLINCIFDPIIYAVRLPKIRNGYAEVWKNFMHNAPVSL